MGAAKQLETRTQHCKYVSPFRGAQQMSFFSFFHAGKRRRCLKIVTWHFSNSEFYVRQAIANNTSIHPTFLMRHQ